MFHAAAVEATDMTTYARTFSLTHGFLPRIRQAQYSDDWQGSMRAIRDADISMPSPEFMAFITEVLGCTNFGFWFLVFGVSLIGYRVDNKCRPWSVLTSNTSTLGSLSLSHLVHGLSLTPLFSH